MLVTTLLVAFVPAAFAAGPCRDTWDPRSCQNFAKTNGCDANGPLAHIVKLCKKSCKLCGAAGGGNTGKQSTDAPRTSEPATQPPRTNRPSTQPPTQRPVTSKPGPEPQPPKGSGNGGGTGSVSGKHCPAKAKFGKGPPSDCPAPTDPHNKPKSKIESWFTKEMFEDLFPGANIGWGPTPCWPYSYEAFVIAARYFPRFGSESPNSVFTPEQNHKRDLAAFFSHAIQETGENNADLYARMGKEEADACFYRGGFYNWYEGGPTSSFLPPDHPGHQPEDGKKCVAAGKYCANDAVNNFFTPCSDGKDGQYFTGCYFGRGAIQISYNFNYGLFSNWLNEQGIKVDLLKEPWLVMTKMDPPLSVMASLWFYMTPQPPKPSMHDIVMGQWNAGPENEAAGYSGPIFGPTSLVINNECGGEDESEPGGPGESRRIKAFKWFAKYFDYPIKDEKTLTCKNMKVRLAQIKHHLSYAPDWSSTWKKEPCQCAPAAYAGAIPHFEKGFYPDVWVTKNEDNKKKCEDILYKNPKVFGVDPKTTACLDFKPKN